MLTAATSARGLFVLCWHAGDVVAPSDGEPAASRPVTVERSQLLAWQVFTSSWWTASLEFLQTSTCAWSLQWDVVVPCHCSGTFWCPLTALLQWDVLVPSHCSETCWCRLTAVLQWDVLVSSHCSETRWCCLLTSVQLIRRCYDYTLLLPWLQSSRRRLLCSILLIFVLSNIISGCTTFSTC